MEKENHTLARRTRRRMRNIGGGKRVCGGERGDVDWRGGVNRRKDGVGSGNHGREWPPASRQKATGKDRPSTAQDDADWQESE